MPYLVNASAHRCRLTPREQDVLRLLDQSLSHRAIAERLTVSEESVGWYVKQLRKKLDAKGKDVPAVARELGLLN